MNSLWSLKDFTMVLLMLSARLPASPKSINSKTKETHPVRHPCGLGDSLAFEFVGLFLLSLAALFGLPHLGQQAAASE